jgi:hypothetical protein
MEAYAIIHPGTMMIHFENTCTANTAMMCPVRFDYLALFAKTYFCKIEIIIQLSFCDFTYSARIKKHLQNKLLRVNEART